MRNALITINSAESGAASSYNAKSRRSSSHLSRRDTDLNTIKKVINTADDMLGYTQSFREDDVESIKQDKGNRVSLKVANRPTELKSSRQGSRRGSLHSNRSRPASAASQMHSHTKLPNITNKKSGKVPADLIKVSAMESPKKRESTMTELKTESMTESF